MGYLRRLVGGKVLGRLFCNVLSVRGIRFGNCIRGWLRGSGSLGCGELEILEGVEY